MASDYAKIRRKAKDKLCTLTLMLSQELNQRSSVANELHVAKEPQMNRKSVQMNRKCCVANEPQELSQPLLVSHCNHIPHTYRGSLTQCAI